MDYLIENKTITFSRSFNNPIDNRILEILKTVEKINFNNFFDYPIDNLPNNIKIINFSKQKYSITSFNQKVDNLPFHLEELYLSDNFNQDIDFLPASLHTLRLGYNFNKPLKNLPSSLKILIINSLYKFNKTNLKEISPTIEKLVVDSFLLDFRNKKNIIIFMKKNYNKLKESNNKYLFELFPFLPTTIKKLGINTGNETIIISF